MAEGFVKMSNSAPPLYPPLLLNPYILISLVTKSRSCKEGKLVLFFGKIVLRFLAMADVFAGF